MATQALVLAVVGTTASAWLASSSDATCVGHLIALAVLATASAMHTQKERYLDKSAAGEPTPALYLHHARHSSYHHGLSIGAGLCGL